MAMKMHLAKRADAARAHLFLDIDFPFDEALESSDPTAYLFLAGVEC